MEMIAFSERSTQHFIERLSSMNNPTYLYLGLVWCMVIWAAVFVRLRKAFGRATAASKSPDYSISFSRDTARRIFFNDLSDSDADTYFAKLSPQPFRVYLEKETVSPKLDWLEVVYVMGSLDQTLSPSLYFERARKLAIKPISVEAGHDMMLSRPEKLVEILVN